MPRLKLSNTAINRLKSPDPSGRQCLHWDTDLKGFGVLVSGKTNAKTYIVQRDVNGKTRRITIGATNVFSLDDARTDAERVLADMYRGIDPKEKRKAELAQGITLGAALDTYLTARKTLRPKTARDYRLSVERYLPGWLETPLKDITPEMVEARHRAIQEEVAQRGRTSIASIRATTPITTKTIVAAGSRSGVRSSVSTSGSCCSWTCSSMSRTTSRC